MLKKYKSNEDLIVATNEYFDQLDERFYRDAIKAVEYSWKMY